MYRGFWNGGLRYVECGVCKGYSEEKILSKDVRKYLLSDIMRVELDSEMSEYNEYSNEWNKDERVLSRKLGDDGFVLT